ncbi:hypothetical protein FYJ80_11225 [Spirochaetales bacterium NM-380-WT-3C1]|uniref:Uncharacterized protein n=1 Tax=Bullifex porci TaxID=2606638 RepID=A0A7X2PEB5_9SPIO|nr:hypothetical protein [Bullifex porci]MSU07319.1 hypothetical protein [Bullifex porci]
MPLLQSNNEINSEVHDTTKEIPFDRLYQKRIYALFLVQHTQAINQLKFLEKVMFYHRGVKTQIDNVYACCEGIIVEKNNAVFLLIDETSIVLVHLLSPKRERAELIYKPKKRNKPNIFISTYQNNCAVFN